MYIVMIIVHHFSVGLPGISQPADLYKLAAPSTFSVSPEIKAAAGDNRKHTAAEIYKNSCYKKTKNTL